MLVTGKSTGFTLLELLVVLAILVLLSVIWPLAAPRLFPAQQLRNEGERLVSVLRATRNTALISNMTSEFSVSADGTSYHAGNEDFRLPQGMRLDKQNEPSVQNTGVVRFFADGSSDGGLLMLTRDMRKNAIVVSRMLGRAEVIS